MGADKTTWEETGGNGESWISRVEPTSPGERQKTATRSESHVMKRSSERRVDVQFWGFVRRLWICVGFVRGFEAGRANVLPNPPTYLPTG